MKVIAVIAEYNPFHYGHLHHLIQSKEKTACTHTMVLMSGDFVQRGSPAFVNKWTRAKIALSMGIDLVCELPYYAAGQSAEYFARGGVDILNTTRSVDYLSFGCEEANISLLLEIAERMIDESNRYKVILRAYLKKGYSFAAARQHTISELYGQSLGLVLSQPNNILAIEYLKALLKTNSDIKPLAIQRLGEGYEAENWPPPSKYASATQIRKGLLAGFDVQPYLPYPVNNLKNVRENIRTGIDKFNLSLVARLLQSTAEELRNLPYVSEGIENRILKSLHTAKNLKDISKYAASKRMPESRLRRILINLMIDMNKNLLCSAYSEEMQPYLRVLGFNTKGIDVLNRIKSHSSIPRITKLKKARKILTQHQQLLLKKDILASNLYQLYFNETFVYNADYYQSPIILK